MESDPTSPVAPARIRTLILPLGRMRRTRFQSFVERIRMQGTIRLGDISPDTSSPDKALFSPLAFPDGNLLYDFTLSLPPAHQVNMCPFEFFRQPLLVLCIADGTEVSQFDDGGRAGDARIENTSKDSRSILEKQMQDIRDQLQSALHVQLLVFNAESSSISSRHVPSGSVTIPPITKSRSTTLKTIMCDISANLLAEMSLMAKSVQRTPSIPSGNTVELALSDSNLEDNGRHALRDEGVRGSPFASNRGIEGEVLPALSEAVLSSSRPTSPTNSEINARSVTTKPDSPQSLSSRSSFTDAASRPKPGDLPMVSKRDRKIFPVSNTSIERERSKLKTRQGLLIGSLYLHAGRWPDALRELVDNTTRAKAFGYHRWFAKGLENILVTLLLLASADMEFTIPSICFALPEKVSSGKRASAGPNSNFTDVRPSDDIENKRTLHSLSFSIPEMVNLIVSNYSCADDDAEKDFPSFTISDCMIRLSRLETFLVRNGGILDLKTISGIVSGIPDYSSFKQISKPLAGPCTRRDISSLLWRAFPVVTSETSSDGPNFDAILLLSRIASVLSFAGLQRKKAMVYRGLLHLLTPAFIEARKRGAAEVGIHPAASLSISSGLASAGLLSEVDDKITLERSLRGVIALLALTYGLGTESALSTETNSVDIAEKSFEKVLGTLDSQPSAILKQAWLNSFGSARIKSDILRLCTNFSEAVPDFDALMISISNTFSAVGPKRIFPLPGGHATNSFFTPIRLSEGEQARLAAKFYQLADSVPLEDEHQFKTPYWDNFLVRAIELEAHPTSTSSIIRSPNETSEGLVSSQRGPFLHEAFAKTALTPTDEVLVAGDSATFLVTLQNPYSFKLFVEDLKFITTGVALISSRQSIILDPTSVRKAKLRAAPNSSGNLQIVGCRIKVRGCRYQDFLIFQAPWAPKSEAKSKYLGLGYLEYTQDWKTKPSLAETTKIDSLPTQVPPKPTKVQFVVLASQPLLSVTTSSLPQSHTTVFAGQTMPYFVTLKNESNSAICDFLSVSFKQTVYNMESTNEGVNSVFKHRKKATGSICIVPGESMTFNFDIVGVSGLTEGTVIFDYAYLGVPLADMKKQFHTRQIQVRSKFTVSSMIQVLRVDTIPLKEHSSMPVVTINALVRSQGPLSHSAQPNSFPDSYEVTKQLLSSRKNDKMLGNPNFSVLLLDLRNSSTRPLRTSFYLKHDSSASRNTRETSGPVLCNRKMVQAGQIIRIAIPVSRILMGTHANDDYYQDSGSRVINRQAGNEAPIIQRFRCEEALFSQIEGIWEDLDAALWGAINLHDLRLETSVVESIYQQEMIVSLKISGGMGEENSVSGTTNFNAQQLLTFIVTVECRSSQDIASVLQLQPRLIGRAIATDMSQHIAWTGSLRRQLPSLENKQVHKVSTGMTFLTPGQYDIRASAYTGQSPLNIKQRRLLGFSDIFISIGNAMS